MSEAAKKHGWLEIVFADGTEVAFRSGDPEGVRGWKLYGSLRCRGASETAALITRAHSEFGGDNRFRIVRKLLRRVLVAQQAKSWDQVLPREIVRWAEQALTRLEMDCDFVDNRRVALRGNTGQVRRYKAQRARGCCGFHDSEEVCPVDGKTYLLGFNFGH